MADEPLVDDRSEAKRWRDGLGYEEMPVASSGKRCGVQWTPWMGDFFTSWSPRNSNNNAEGPWDHWVDLALHILRDPLTAIVRPEAYAAVGDVSPVGFYTETGRDLTDEELMTRLRPAPPKGGDA